MGDDRISKQPVSAEGASTDDPVNDDGSHHYINWPRERVCWWKLERTS